MLTSILNSLSRQRRWACLALTVFAPVSLSAKAPPVEKLFGSSDAARLVRAARQGDAVAVRKIIVGGVDPSVATISWCTPLAYVMLDQDKKAFMLLLEHGADPNVLLRDPPIIPDSVVSLAAQATDSFWLKEVLNHGGDPNLLSARVSRTPIFFAVGTQRLDLIKLLVERGAKLEIRDSGGDTALTYGAKMYYWKSVSALIAHGARPELLPTKGGFLSAMMTYNRHPGVDRTSEVWRAFVDVVKQLRASGAPLPTELP